MQVLAVSGDLGIESSVSFTEAVEKAGASSPTRIVVDLSGVRSVDAIGACALAAAINLAAGPCRVVLRSLRPALRQIVAAVSPDLDLTGSGLVMAHPDVVAGIDPGCRTWALQRESKTARSRAQQTMIDTRRAAEMIAATEDKVAATLLRLAPQRPGQYDDLKALSQLASTHAERMRNLTGNTAQSRANVAAAAGPQDTATDTLRRSISFINERARDDITAADIAAAACVTTRAVQLAFRRYLGITPLGYLRQVRLEQAHRELLAATPAQRTVTKIATDWRFTNLSRFTNRYREAYGVLPSHTLHNGTKVS